MSTDLAVRQVALVTDDLDPVVDQLAAVFDLAVAFRDPLVGRFGLRNVVVPVGDQFLEVVAPVEDGTAAGRYLTRRHGPGGYLLITESPDPDFADAQAARHDARVIFGFDDDGFRCRQFHPADTGAVFLEIDHQSGAGRWHPAGPDWQRARRTEVVTGIAAVTVQTSDPAGLTARWAQLTTAPVTGPTTLTFTNARVQIVAPGDDRGPGLTAVTMMAADPVRARRAAAGLGLLHDDGAIGICGMRFVLADSS